MIMKTENEVIELMNIGWTIDYAPISGDILLIGNHRAEESQSIDISMFLDMRAAKKIKRIRTMKNTHPLFHGLVEVYGLATEDN